LAIFSSQKVSLKGLLGSKTPPLFVFESYANIFEIPHANTSLFIRKA